MPSLKLMAELGLDGSSFAAGFQRAKGLAEGVAEGIKHVVIGAIGIATVEEAISRTVETAKELVETSERLAIAPEQLQVLRQAAKNANVDFEKLVETMEKLSIAREKALMPGAEGFDARRAFRAMGVSNEQLHGMTSSQLLLGPIRNAVLGRNPEELGIIFRELGVKAFGGLIPLLKTNFGELESSMQKLGMLMDTETAVKLKQLSQGFGYLAAIIATRLGPALISLTEIFIKIFAGLGSAWVYLSTLLRNPKTGENMARTMAAQSGFGGPNASQKQAMEDLREHPVSEAEEKTARDKAYEAAKQFAFKWIDTLDEMEKKFKEMAAELNNPAPPDLGGSSIPPKLPRKALVEQSDSLVKIGNFLGGNDRIINRLQEKQVYWLEKIHGRLKVNSGYLSTMQFPVQGAVSNIVNPNIMMGPNMPQN